MSISMHNNSEALHKILDVGFDFLIENPLTGMCVTENGEIIVCNRRFADIFGFATKELLGVKFNSLLQPQQALSSENKPLVQDCEGKRKDGSIIYTRLSQYEIQSSSKEIVIWHLADVSEHKAAEISFKESEKHLNWLATQIMEGQEAERKRVASELHDGIGQILTTIKFGLEQTLHDLHDNRQEEALDKIVSTFAGVRNALEEVRRISMNLRPAILDDLGVEASINWLCRLLDDLHPTLCVSKKIDLGKTQLSKDLQVAVFRVLQEASNNAAKYSNATHIKIILKIESSNLILSIRDNGQGFSVPDAMRDCKGFGLHSMNERVRASGGKLDICSFKGAGTHIKASWDCSKVFPNDEYDPPRMSDMTNSCSVASGISTSL